MWSTESMEPEEAHGKKSLFSKVDVPDQAHYVVAFFVFVIGALGIIGNALVMFAFYRWVWKSFFYSKQLNSRIVFLLNNACHFTSLLILVKSPIEVLELMSERYSACDGTIIFMTQNTNKCKETTALKKTVA